MSIEWEPLPDAPLPEALLHTINWLVQAAQDDRVAELAGYSASEQRLINHGMYKSLGVVAAVLAHYTGVAPHELLEQINVPHELQNKMIPPPSMVEVLLKGAALNQHK